jgi:hypothetical protein
MNDEGRMYAKRREKLVRGESHIVQNMAHLQNEVLADTQRPTLSRADFQKFFTRSEGKVALGLQQKNSRDCYLDAAIEALSRSSFFELLVRSSVTINPDSSWTVCVPLLNSGARKINIRPDDLLPQRNVRFMRQDYRRTLPVPDMRRTLYPAEGNAGFRVLAAAYIKSKFGRVDRDKAQSGNGDEVLLKVLGDNARMFSVGAYFFDPATEEFHAGALGDLKGAQRAKVDHFLETFDPNMHIATVGSRKDMRGLLTRDMLGGTPIFLFPNHAFAVIDIDKGTHMVTLADPKNSNKLLHISSADFLQKFTSIESVKFDMTVMAHAVSEL